MTDVKAKRDWALIAAGIIMIVCAAAIAAFPGFTLITVATFAGAAFLVSGIGNVISFIKLRNANNASIWTLLYAVLDVVVGLMMLLHPLASAAVIPWLVALCFFVLGAYEFVAAIKMRQIKLSSWSWTLVSGIVNIMGSVILFMFTVFLASMFSIMVAVRGVSMIVLGSAAGKYQA